MDKFLTHLDSLVDAYLLRHVDAEFARFVAGRGANYEVVLAALAASYQLGQNHSYADLEALAGQQELIAGTGIKPPTLEAWLEALGGSALVGSPAEPSAFVLEGGQFYLARYFSHEVQVAARLVDMARDLPTDDARLAERLGAWFPPTNSEVDWQRVAAAIAFGRQLSVITGGPGTGKTTTVVRILGLLLEQGAWQIRLAAPTGKAATRLASTIKAALSALEDESLLARIPTEVTTLHRLLGSRPGTLNQRYNRENPLPLDVLVLDEASMVDLPLMARLLEALPKHARLILLGDKDQLPAVEAGNLLADICAAAGLDRADTQPHYSPAMARRLQQLCGLELPHAAAVMGPLADSLCPLQKSYRFDADAGIGQFARAVNRGDSTAVAELFQSHQKQPATGELSFSAVDQAGLYAGLAAPYRLLLEGFAELDPLDALRRLDNYRVMCALREGPYGVEDINRGIEQLLHREGMIDADEEFYRFRPVMVVENDYSVGLFNGDVGLVVKGQGGETVVAFSGPDGELREVLPSRLPAVVTCYAMTVHKSQGSEFDQAALVLPPLYNNKLAPILTRELLYTAITRARRQLAIYADENVLRMTCERQLRRASGLPGRLQQ